MNIIHNSNSMFSNKNVLSRDTTRFSEINGVTFVEFKPFDRFDWIKLHFSTRLGGVSSQEFTSMNFSFDRGDDYSNVLENFNRFTATLGLTPDNCVSSKQTHTKNVLKVDRMHSGMGVTRDRDFTDIDGLITNEKNLCLVTSFADCVPVYFVDEKNHCIGASHSGWRGTVANITEETLKRMKEEYGTNPKDVYAFIGPSICQDCYEVDDVVYNEFREKYSEAEMRDMFVVKDNGKYQLSLWMANYYNMINSGIKSENIGITDLCTCCNSDILFSHRASKGKRGVLCGFMCITK